MDRLLESIKRDLELVCFALKNKASLAAHRNKLLEVLGRVRWDMDSATAIRLRTAVLYIAAMTSEYGLEHTPVNLINAAKTLSEIRKRLAAQEVNNE